MVARWECISPWPRALYPVSSLLAIAAELSAPPSSPLCFRDLTLWASIRGFTNVAVLDDWNMRDGYNLWFRRYGLYDYLDDLVAPGDLGATVEIVGGQGAALTAHNLALVISTLPPLPG